MKLSVIIPAYNVERYISRCLESILKQGLKTDQYEVIIINDGSTDNSELVAGKYASKHLNFYVINKENGGVGSARNAGVKLAKGKFIYFIDPDDYLAQNVLPILIDYAEKFELQILTFQSTKTSDIDLHNSKTQHISGLPSLIIENGIEYIGKRKYQNEVWWYLINRNFLENSNIKFIEGGWMEDAIFTANLFLKVDAISHIAYDVHRHVETPNSAMTNKEPQHYLKIIKDNANAALVFKSLIEKVKPEGPTNIKCINRLKARQQSFVFFMMVRMLKSSIGLDEVKSILTNLTKIGAYPLNSFLGGEYNKKAYYILVALFNNRYVYYLIFSICNPIFNWKKA